MKKKILSAFLCAVIISLALIAVDIAAAAGQVKINIGFDGMPINSLDPASLGSGTCAQFYNVFEPLIGFDAKKKMTGILAESWFFSPDGKTLIMKLRKNVKFSTGEIFTAKDVIFSLERSIKYNSTVRERLNPKVYDHAEVVDNTTVKFIFPKVNVQFLPQTLTSLRIASEEQYNKLGEEEWLKNPSGTGPYRIVDWKPNDFIGLAINANYRGKRPQVTEAHFLYVSNPDVRINMLLTGKTDLINQTAWKTVAELEKVGFSRYDMELPSIVALQFHLLNPKTPWAFIKVRQAINYAIDKQSLIEKNFNGVPKPGTWQLPWELGYDDSHKPAYLYDPAKAKELMKEAGFEKGFEIPLICMGKISWAKIIADNIAGTLKQIGITVKLNSAQEFPQFNEEIKKLKSQESAKATVLFDYNWPGNPDPVINLMNGFRPDDAVSMYSRPDLEVIIEKALLTLDNNKRAELIKQAYKIINDDLPFIPIYIEQDVHMMNTKFKYVPSLGGMENGPMNVFDLKLK